ncbi:MAG: DUF262 domain-containing protein [Azonexus sp.]|jgi:hypothetical protein|nr:DUF262 domain-containing protein [Azonexus sp.]
MNYQSATIAETLWRINDEDLFIPSIQRPYVWDTKQIVSLFDSLMQGYPINTFLFWELQSENIDDWDIYKFISSFRYNGMHNEKIDLTGECRPITLVLDGQQRLTSLLIGLKGSYYVRNGLRGRGAAYVTQALYLNLLKTPDSPADSDDEGVVKESFYGFKFFDIESSPRDNSTAIWFPVNKILKITSDELLNTAIEREFARHSLNTTQQSILRNNLTRLYQIIHHEDCIAYYTERDQDSNKILSIFIRANAGGTQLGKSDLFMSMVTLGWKHLDARKATEELADYLHATLEQDNGFGYEYQLRSGLFFNDLSATFQTKNFSSSNIATLERRWLEIDRALRLTADLFNRIGITGSYLPSFNVVMLVSCYVFKLNDGKPVGEWSLCPEDEESIRRWVIFVLFRGVLGATTNIMIDYRRALNKHIEFCKQDGQPIAFPARKLNEYMDNRGRIMKFDNKAIDDFCLIEARDRSGLGRPCLSLLYDRTDWKLENFNVVQIVPSSQVGDEHIELSENKIEDGKSWGNTLANSVLMPERDAREYRDMGFDDWIATRQDQFAKHLLPSKLSIYGKYGYDFSDFIKERRQLIANRLCSLFD